MLWGLLMGIGLILWGTFKILGTGSWLLPWVAVPLGILIILVVGSPYTPRHRPGEYRSETEEHHYFGTPPEERRRHDR